MTVDSGLLFWGHPVLVAVVVVVVDLYSASRSASNVLLVP